MSLGPAYLPDFKPRKGDLNLGPVKAHAPMADFQRRNSPILEQTFDAAHRQAKSCG